jgi:hypothetical protein
MYSRNGAGDDNIFMCLPYSGIQIYRPVKQFFVVFHCVLFSRTHCLGQPDRATVVTHVFAQICLNISLASFFACM